jgi:ubiquinone/menaquinone biosynthesis C-methylase UbiE
MPDVQRRFYTEAYPARKSATPRHDMPGFLQRHELHRTDAAIRLLPRGGRLLDVGCGNGTLLMKCAADFDHLVGVDVADTQISGARSQLAAAGVDNVQLVLANIDTGLPLASRQFDVVTAIAVLGIIFDPVAALEELRRVLKPGGCLAIEVLNLVYLPRRLALVMGRLPAQTTCHGWEGGHLHNFTRAAVLDLLQTHGFALQHCTGSGVFTSLRTWWPSMLLGNVIAVSTKR